jgi:MerR family transcriptional regulator, copper efflux regulator
MQLTLDYTPRCMFCFMMDSAKPLTIGRLAELTGTSADTLRYYEKLGLVVAAQRSRSGYRLYGEDAIRQVRFIRGAKALQFTLEEIKQLLRLLARTEAKINEAEQRIRDLNEIKAVLGRLAKACPGGEEPASQCPILDHLRDDAA